MSRLSPYLIAVWGLTPTAWLTLWLVLAGLTVLLVLLLRSKWSKAQPWRKCAILSLWVHVLLGCVAMTVRIVTGPPGEGPETPIRVTVLAVESFEVQPEPEETVPEETAAEDSQQDQHPDEAQPPAVDQPTTAENLPPTESPNKETAELEAPALLATEPSAPEPDVAAEAERRVEAAPEPQQIQTAQPPPDRDHQSEPAAQMADATSGGEKPSQRAVKPSTRPLDVYADRFARNRQQIVTHRGGSAQTEQAVRAALSWLAEAQSKDGRWDASRFGAGEERVVLGHNRQGAGANADTGVTGLALLAFLGSGHSHRGGPYAKQVAHGLEFLRQNQRADGSLFGDAQLFAQMYCHSMASIAVCEAYALTRDPRLEQTVRAAVHYSLAAQNRSDGGWRYRPGNSGDTSQLGWQLMVLKSAELAGVDIPSVTWTRAERFLRRVRRGSTGGLAAYRPEAAASPTMTAEALFCRNLLSGSESVSLAATLEACESITGQLPSSKHSNLYYWYYATLALNQSQYRSEETADAWRRWNMALTSRLLTSQQDDGSWSEATVWGGYGGRVYTTALSALCLEVYYRYSPDDPPSAIADRNAWHPIQR